MLTPRLAKRLLVQESDGRPVPFAEMADRSTRSMDGLLPRSSWMSDRRGETWFFAPERCEGDRRGGLVRMGSSCSPCPGKLGQSAPSSSAALE